MKAQKGSRYRFGGGSDKASLHIYYMQKIKKILTTQQKCDIVYKGVRRAFDGFRNKYCFRREEFWSETILNASHRCFQLRLNQSSVSRAGVCQNMGFQARTRFACALCMKMPGV